MNRTEPEKRKLPRRLRHNESIRKMVRQIRLSPENLIQPIFVTHGQGTKTEIESMPGQYQLSVDMLAEECQSIVDLGIPAIMLFGIPESKDAVGSGSFHENGVVQDALREIKKQFPDLVAIADSCLCEYTDHGHCGVLNTEGQNANLPNDYVLNDETLLSLQKVVISQAAAGADIIAPSGMMDNMVAAIRSALDDNQFEHIPIMSYAVKYASAFYGPFRDAAEGAPKFGDRKTHQMDPANLSQALLEADIDVAQGTDFLMVKPALAYLDIICRLKDRYPETPLVAYNVSGEYSMIKAAAKCGWLHEKDAALESLLAIKRAGADLIITYHAKDAVRWLSEK